MTEVVGVRVTFLDSQGGSHVTHTPEPLMATAASAGMGVTEEDIPF
jgi:hypothetical protein